MKITRADYYSLSLVLLLSWGTFLPAAYGEDRSFSDTKIAAEKGDAKAQFNLGVMYVLGQGTPQDYKEVLKWYRKAAEQGHAQGQRDVQVYCTKEQTFEHFQNHGVDQQVSTKGNEMETRQESKIFHPFGPVWEIKIETIRHSYEKRVDTQVHCAERGQQIRIQL